MNRRIRAAAGLLVLSITLGFSLSLSATLGQARSFPQPETLALPPGAVSARGMHLTLPVRTPSGELLRLTQSDARLFCEENQARLPRLADWKSLFESPHSSLRAMVETLGASNTPVFWTDETRGLDDYWSVGFELATGRAATRLFWDDELPVICVRD